MRTEDIQTTNLGKHWNWKHLNVYSQHIYRSNVHAHVHTPQLSSAEHHAQHRASSILINHWRAVGSQKQTHKHKWPMDTRQTQKYELQTHTNVCKPHLHCAEADTCLWELGGLKWETESESPGYKLGQKETHTHMHTQEKGNLVPPVEEAKGNGLHLCAVCMWVFKHQHENSLLSC